MWHSKQLQKALGCILPHNMSLVGGTKWRIWMNRRQNMSQGRHSWCKGPFVGENMAQQIWYCGGKWQNQPPLPILTFKMPKTCRINNKVWCSTTVFLSQLHVCIKLPNGQEGSGTKKEAQTVKIANCIKCKRRRRATNCEQCFSFCSSWTFTNGEQWFSFGSWWAFTNGERANEQRNEQMKKLCFCFWRIFASWRPKRKKPALYKC